ncbi:rna-directed dna polymerase from mobile element jockey-like protein [Lasius niger]|uniref:Rna-directed dna polymerase from mobile element jockey-like protein n=1 Tax=Lasius niger TaxID=67767 RepID=A0A0J7K6C5_LASNI|nr:rna-directed dna polymerase from mobile element jockey-like protein [Lasius niger]
MSKRVENIMVIPIPKIKKPIKASDYRPINVLPVYEKVLELVVKERLEKYLEENEVLTEHQSGFRKSYSCETAIQGTIDEWKVEIAGRKMVGVIFMDLKRAFETVDRKRLLGKLYQIGIRGKMLDWLRSYLHNRTQKVRFYNLYSKLMAINHGVPQGSVLGPLLFILYINDIIEVCPKGSNVKLFADDTMIYVSGESSEELNKKLNESGAIERK